MFKNKLINFLASIKLAIFLLLTLAGTSVIGTILPQGQPIAFYFQRYGETLGQIIKFLQLYDTYHSWWFVTLLVLFSINLILCSLKRLPFSLELYRRDPLAVDPKRLLRMPAAKKVSLNKDISSAKKQIKKLIEKKLGRVKEVEFEDGVLFLKDKFRFSYFSVYLVHFSILVVIVGAIIGAVWGFRGSMTLLEGESSNQVILFGLERRVHPLDFSIRCDKFEIEFYPNGMPKEYRSEVTIIENGKEVLKAPIEVNAPLTYKGVTFYQASYNTFAQVTLRLMKGPRQKILVIKPFSQVEWPEEGLRIGLLNFQEAHGLIAVQLWVSEKDSPPISFWVLQRHPRRIELPKGGSIIVDIADIRPVYATGLQVKKDPGVWVVWLGFLGIIIGIFAAFFFAHQRYWVAIIPDKNSTKVILAGYSPKARHKVEKLIEELSEEVENLNKAS
ncbi:cytochrome c-type forming protein Ccs1 [Thermodesulfatator indicus DSM 15286]|uniref:Cytochrome c-type forming protein Ccs1 n=1 Tax=Thermodesulfatator indicus (strain DSM 15286 / JCM 11887 / CIR29812) TaxID=667014 RepID=F8AAT8_THEID|nr:cytochrome c biogenesis protein ResB [Thermodesulfatator indicus]AEH45449.1 cytochrome c-type forming protein Ccs1 [Thermodesulfatator indicus DSM 15286]